MRTVFIDTVGLIAVWHRRDQWHIEATVVYSQLVQQNFRLVTTPMVLYECGNAGARMTFRSAIDDLRQQLVLAGDLLIPTEEDERQAWQNFRLGFAANAGIVDQISFVVMRRFGLTEAFTNDAHFRAAGFQTLIQTSP